MLGFSLFQTAAGNQRCTLAAVKLYKHRRDSDTLSKNRLHVKWPVKKEFILQTIVQRLRQQPLLLAFFYF